MRPALSVGYARRARARLKKLAQRQAAAAQALKETETAARAALRALDDAAPLRPSWHGGGHGLTGGGALAAPCAPQMTWRTGKQSKITK